MNKDLTNLTQLSNAQVKYPNSAGNYLYYFQENSSASEGLGYVRRVTGVFRSKKNGKDAECLKRNPSGIITLVDNSLYYQNYNNTEGITLYKINLDKSDDMQLYDYIINQSSVINNKLYFNGM